MGFSAARQRRQRGRLWRSSSRTERASAVISPSGPAWPRAARRWAWVSDVKLGTSASSRAAWRARVWRKRRGGALAGLAEAARRAEVGELVEHAAIDEAVRGRARAPRELDRVGREQGAAEEAAEPEADRAPRDDQPLPGLGRLAAGLVLAG